MDGTGKNVKLKRKANKQQKDGGSKWRREWRQPLKSVNCNPRREIQLRSSGCLIGWKPALVARKALGNASRDRHLELFMLIRFYHEQDPED
jgi:hypothetical protein